VFWRGGRVDLTTEKYPKVKGIFDTVIGIHILVAFLWGAVNRSGEIMNNGLVVDHEVEEDRGNWCVWNLQFMTCQQNTAKRHAHEKAKKEAAAAAAAASSTDRTRTTKGPGTRRRTEKWTLRTSSQ